MNVPTNYRPGFLRRTRVTDGFSLFLALSLTAIGVLLIVSTLNPAIALLPFVAVVLAVVLWRYPISTVFCLLLMATLVEFFGEPGVPNITAAFGFWRNLSTSGIAPLPINPAELTFIAGVAVWFIRGLGSQTLEVRGSPLFRGYGLYLLVVVFAAVRGIMAGGDSTITLWEIRAPVYGPIALFLALNLLKTQRHLNMISWIIILGTGLKGVQGSWLYLVTYGGSYEGNALLSHDDALFFPAYYVFVVLMYVFGASRAQKRVGLLFLPWVFIADLANNRRASTGALIIGLVALLFFFFRILPRYRVRVLKLSLIVAVIIGIYAGAFWNSSSRWGKPVQSIKSQFVPSARDESSDLYREQEAMSLMIQIRNNPLIGQGYGIELPLLPGMVDIRNIAPFILYMPHNSILWVWWRTGLIGFTFFWMAMGLAIIRNCFLMRQETNAQVRRWAVFAISVTIMHLLLGWWDLGLESYRQAVYVWIILAVPEILRRLNKESVQPAVSNGGVL